MYVNGEMNFYLYILDRRRPQRRRRHRLPPMSRTSSFSSITDSTMSLNIITVSLNMDTVNFLGISIVGQSNKGGDGGIYVGSIMKGYVFYFNAMVFVLYKWHCIMNNYCRVQSKYSFITLTSVVILLSKF